MKSFFYISTGEQTKMYTLREQYEDFISVDGETCPIIRDYYIRNLSIDKDKAVKVAEELGYTVDAPMFSLEEIKRRNDELAKEKRLQIEAENERLRAERMNARQEEAFALISDGVFPFGKKKLESFDDVRESDPSYIKYWINKVKSDDNVVITLVNILTSKFSDLIERQSNGEFFGEVKTRYKKVKVEVTDAFGFEGYYGWVSVVKFLTESGERLVYKGSTSPDVAVGETVKLDFTVKEHTEYDGENQTMVLRIKPHD